ncbi:hypothetical protein FZW96_14450 [Bacillus sp. BGMRC 2118]|nr:hypothetical protein FZW96_14450 [Bacillus sp. BGMRC 2118]
MDNEQSIFDKKDAYQPLVKNAKKKSLKRTILVSTGVMAGILIILGIVITTLYFVMERSMGAYQEIKMEQDIVYGANIQLDHSTGSYGIDSILMQDQYIKDIDGVPYTWYNEQTWFRLYDKATTVFDNSISSLDNERYYRNGQRVVNFYIPNGENHEDDRNQVQSLAPDSVVELALSFSGPMSPEEMKKKFPNAQWAWVQHPDSIHGSGRVIGDYAYGFTLTKKGITKDVEYFQKVLNSLSKKVEKDTRVTPLLQSIKEKGRLEVSGVIVTGTVQELLPLVEKEDVKYVSLGVVLPY